MGFGGINCHITLVSGDAPDRRLEPSLDEQALLVHAQETELIVLGADSPGTLVEKVTALKQAADGISMAELADLSADLLRQVSPDAGVKAAVVAGHPDDLVARLDKLEEK